MFETLWTKVDPYIPFGLSKTEFWAILFAAVTVLSSFGYLPPEILEWMKEHPVELLAAVGAPTALFIKDATRKDTTRVDDSGTNKEQRPAKRLP